MLIEGVLLVLLLGLVWHYSTRDPPRFPPGPSRIPILGTKPLRNDADMKAFRQQYGSIFRTRIGNSSFVFLCDYRQIREAFNKIEFSNRPDLNFMKFLSDGKEAGVVFRSGPAWQTLRRFLLRHLRDLGMGKSRLDDVILREAQELVESFKGHVGSPTFFPKTINSAILNVIWQLVASKRYNLEDKRIADFSALMVKFQDDMKLLILPDFFPWLNYLPAFLRRRLLRLDILESSAKVAKAMMQEVIDEHRESLDLENPRDLLDEFLVEMDKAEPHEDNPFNEVDLMSTIFDLFTAGYDTTSNMLRWVLLYMAAHPHAQDKVQQELDEVVPRDTLPSHQYRQRLPYLDAVLHEVLRVSSLAGGGVPHAVARDTHFAGYFFPKGTIVTGHVSACHLDPLIWDDPEVFRPERFLDDVGKFQSPKEGFLPFGVGKRSCLGEALARMELYVFSAALLQNFSFSPPTPGAQVDLTPRPIDNLKFPKDQEIMIAVRK